MKGYLKAVGHTASESLIDGGILYASKAALDAAYGLAVQGAAKIPGLKEVISNQYGALAFKPLLAFFGSALIDEHIHNKWARRVAEGMAVASVFELASTLADPFVYGTPAAPGPVLKLAGVAPVATSGRISSNGRITTGARLLPGAIQQGGNMMPLRHRTRGTAGMVSMMG